MLTARNMGIELLRAGLVLALVFLSFAHPPFASAATPHGHAVAAGISWCGDAPEPVDPAAHSPCHACRLGAGIDLPPPGPVLLPHRTAAALRYDALPSLLLPTAPPGHATARGPPRA